MQFTTPTQQLTTCPQCDNVVRIDAEFCNICGKRLRPANTVSYLSTGQQGEDDEEYEDDEDYLDDENEGEPGTTSLTLQKAPSSTAIPPSASEILGQLRRLQEQTDQMERYFPADLPGKEQKLSAWKKQLLRALACIELCERPQFQQTESQQPLKLRHHIAEAARALDFTREYTVKLVGHAGAGKSTLLAALIGQDIFPRLAGGAVTGVCTRVRLCGRQEQEEMRAHFLTRSAFDALLKNTQQSIKETASQQTREALARELAIVLKAGEAYGEQYLREGQAYVEHIPRARWQAESSRYIEEPSRDSEEPRLVRLIDYVEYTVHGGAHALLPPGSVLVDLPGGSAGQLHHDAILRDELNNVDAVILVVGNNRFGDDDRTQRIFDMVRRKVVQGRSPEVAARMVYLAVTHWDEINSAASLEKALGSLRPLLRDLPPNYSSYHHHGGDNGYFFYPLRALDGLLATLGLEKQKLDADRQQEGRDYAGRILSVYPELLRIDATLPTGAAAQEYQKVSAKQHEAMLRYSGLPELTRDLQTFLTTNRYEVQLRQAETQLAMALQQLEDFCWEQLNQHGIQSRDLEELRQEINMRQSKRGATRFEQIQRRTHSMRDAWKDALKEFDEAIRADNNAFHHALLTAHDRAARRIKIRILQGHFDHFIKVGLHIQADSPAMEIGNRWVDIDGWNLIKDLRVSFTAALEREMQEPARTLAEAFLISIAHKEEIDGSLDIHNVALGEYGGELDEIQKAYGKLKRSIRDKARDVCLYVTMGELLNEEKYAPSKDDPAVSALYRLAATPGKPEDIIQQSRQLMGPILDVICGHLAQSTERRIAHLFRYELDKLEERQAFDSDRLDVPPATQPGAFTELINRLYSLLAERVLTSNTLREQLDLLQAQQEMDVDRWIELINDTEALKTMHRQA
ncbi:MAG TPA: dynamin family protein [Ktedonobacteraceae bacterium]|nr:dynamin family protein [Ktedonobacteraceae bacterium]